MMCVNTVCEYLKYKPLNQSSRLVQHKQESTHSNKMLRTEESNYKRSVKDGDDSVRQSEHESSSRYATHKRIKFVQVCRGTLYNPLRDADKCTDLNQNRTVIGGLCVIKKSLQAD